MRIDQYPIRQAFEPALRRAGLHQPGQNCTLGGMPMTIEQLAEGVLTLPGEQRALLADRLVESLDAAEISRIDRLWATEAKRRRDEVRSGLVQTIPGERLWRGTALARSIVVTSGTHKVAGRVCGEHFEEMHMDPESKLARSAHDDTIMA